MGFRADGGGVESEAARVAADGYARSAGVAARGGGAESKR